MKTFEQLCIGDPLYRVYTNYESSIKPIFFEYKITALEIKEKDGKKVLVINKKGNGYNDFEGFLIDLKNKTTVAFNGDTGYFTTDKKMVNTLLRRVGLNNIKAIEAEIVEKQKAIENLRAAYWDYLNNTEVYEEEEPRKSVKKKEG